jgi:endoglycosylceramidase
MAFLQSNRVRIFHGVNAVNKGWPWYPYWLQNDTLLDELSSWGVNAVRVGWMWSGFNGLGPGVFNETYYQIQEDIVDRLASRGIHAFLDMHQVWR